ncbi:MAG: FG-GAP-like repeat-containing protein, partial [Planctomycetota bacterium]
FAPEVAYAGVDGLRGLAIGDLDGDGDIDVVVTNRNDLSVSVLLNLGDGTFAPQVAYDASSPVAVAIGDLDGDGDADLAIANDVFVAADSLGVLLNNGDGTFATEVRYDVGVDPAAVVLGDLDGDGDLDAAVANFGPAFFGPGSLSVLLNSGDGMFGSQVEYDAGDGGESPASVAIGDLDGDGDTDLAVANAGGFGDGTLVSVHLNGGDGSFAPQVMYEAGDGAQSVAIGDLDGDGDADLAVANAVSDRVSVLLNLGDGTFGPEVPFSAGDGPRSVALSDFDGDGSLDVATANGGSFRPDGVSVLLNQCGTGTEPCVPDLDGDGELTIFDFLEFQSLFATGDARADLDGSGTLDIFDFLAFQSAFAIGCP